MSHYTDDSNYYGDRRVIAANRRNRLRIINGQMKAHIDVMNEDGSEEIDVEVPIIFEVCPTCEGKGTHVNPSIDAGGLSADDFMEDPDFTEEYVNGLYDVDCYECGGNKVIPVLNRDIIDEELLSRIDEQEKADLEHRMEIEAERRAGC